MTTQSESVSSKDSKFVLVACYLAVLSVGDNSTAIMAALPTMRSDLQLGPTLVEWVVNAYLLAAAVFIVLGGDAADRLGARSSSTIGVALFAIASRRRQRQRRHRCARAAGAWCSLGGGRYSRR